MAPSVRPEPDPMLRLQYFRDTGQPDQAKLYEQYLRETGQYREPAPPVTPHGASGTWSGNEAADLRANEMDARVQAAMKRFPRMSQPVAQLYVQQQQAQQDAIEKRKARLLNFGQGMYPGMRGAESAGMALVRGYGLSPEGVAKGAAAVDSAVQNLPRSEQMAGRMAGGVMANLLTPGMGKVPGSVYGGVFSAADKILSPEGYAALASGDPAQFKDLARQAAISGGEGYLVGKNLEALGTLARARAPQVLGGPGLRSDVARRWEQAADAINNQNFGRVADEITLSGGTSPNVRAMLQDKDFQSAVAHVSQLAQNQGKSDAEILKEAMTFMGDQQRRFATVADPNNPTFGSVQGQKHVTITKGRGRTAMGTESTTPEMGVVQGPMTPSEVSQLTAAPPESWIGRMVQRRPREPVQVGTITTPPVSPSIQYATAEHANLMANREAANEAGRITRMAADKAGTNVPEADVIGNTPSSYVKDVVPQLPTREAATLGRDMSLAALREKQGEQGFLPWQMIRHPFETYGRSARVTPIVRALDVRAGGPVWANILPNTAFATLRGLFGSEAPRDLAQDQEP